MTLQTPRWTTQARRGRKMSKKRKYEKNRAPDLNKFRKKVCAHWKGEVQQFKTVEHVSLLFENLNMKVSQLIKEVPYLQVCVCWLTDNVLLKALKERTGVSIIISRSKTAQRKKKIYKVLPAMNKQKGAVRVIGAEGKHNSLCHHKFAIGLDKNKVPVFLATGSFNWSVQGGKNLENLIIFRDVKFIKAWQKEFELLWAKSVRYI